MGSPKHLSTSVTGLAGAAQLEGGDSKAGPTTTGPPTGLLSPHDGPEVKELKFGIIVLTVNSTNVH